MSQEPSLLPCPFCAAPAEYDSQRYMPPTRPEYRGQTGHAITCSKCEAEIGLFDCYEDARDAWNKRTAQAVAAHAREPDEAMAIKAGCEYGKRLPAQVLDGCLFPDCEDSLRCSYLIDRIRAALAAIGPGRTDRDAVIEECAQICQSAHTNENPGYLAAQIRKLKSSPEKPPAPTPPAAERSLRDILIDRLNRSGIPEVVRRERAKPAASGLERAQQVVDDWVADGTGWIDTELKELRDIVITALADARRETAADMRERDIKLLRAMQSEQFSAYFRDAVSISQAVLQEAADRLAALPLTEEETP